MSTQTLLRPTHSPDKSYDHVEPAAASRGDPEFQSAPFHIPNVLIIEDNPGDVELTMLAFEARGLIADFHIAVDGSKALSYLAGLASSLHPRPDLILLDLNLPKVTGAEILAFLKRHPYLSGIPTAILTSSNAPDDVERCSSLGVDAYLVKPMTLHGMLEMMKRIASLLERPQTPPR